MSAPPGAKFALARHRGEHILPTRAQVSYLVGDITSTNTPIASQARAAARPASSCSRVASRCVRQVRRQGPDHWNFYIPAASACRTSQESAGLPPLVVRGRPCRAGASLIVLATFAVRRADRHADRRTNRRNANEPAEAPPSPPPRLPPPAALGCQSPRLRRRSPHLPSLSSATSPRPSISSPPLLPPPSPPSPPPLSSPPLFCPHRTHRNRPPLMRMWWRGAERRAVRRALGAARR